MRGMKEIHPNDFKVDSPIRLNEKKTRIDLLADPETIKSKMKKTRKKLGKLQDTQYAHGKYAVLVCLQGMDTSGKDSLIREVFKDFNSRGVVVHSFKVPTEKELKHDYLWRHYLALPERGKFSIFNRTHYENVLVTRVHPEYLLGENLPELKSLEGVTDQFWEKRFEQIRNFEKHLSENGTIIFKFYLHLSKKEQKNRLLRRLVKENKHWKFSPGDLEERALWQKYQVCYEEAINRTSEPHAPWYVIPADDKDTARYLVANTLFEVLSKYADIREPELDPEIKANLQEYIDQLKKE
jgi:PPK2 family polyphosphate:nucleotide phosphotransferase